MFHVSVYHSSAPDERLLSDRPFATPEAAALYGDVLVDEPEVYAGEDDVADHLAEQADVREWSYVVSEVE